jgi:hypothetical protein
MEQTPADHGGADAEPKTRTPLPERKSPQPVLSLAYTRYLDSRPDRVEWWRDGLPIDPPEAGAAPA